MKLFTIKFINATIVFVIISMALFLLGSSARAKITDRVVIKKIVPIISKGEPRPNEFKSDVSQKNILGLDRPAPFSLPTAKRGIPIAASVATVDSINVLVLKVEFQPEIPDNPKTTGIGTFDMRTYEQFVEQEGNYIDPAPHNSSYFAAHMEALRRYWSYVSEGKLEITWDIYPQDETTTLRLPHYMSYYGSEGPWADSSIGDKLGHFLIDAVTFADTTMPQIDFSRYKSIIVFHAGSDQQNNIAFINDTPDDFYTGFLRLAEPVSVDDGSVTIQEGILMPETASQDNRVTALNAVMAHEFGHQLGLVDLYNTSNFMTEIGDFSLMDDNGASVGVVLDTAGTTVAGTVPVYPDAWSRAYLGFDVPREITQGTGDSISAAYLPYSDKEIIKVPVTEFEYFLIENRQQDPVHSPALEGDPTTGVILGVEDSLTLEPISDYDIFVPGSGVLIWHIDESVAYLDYTRIGGNNFLNNTLQWDSNRRFVSVVEADGAVDFGGYYYAGYGDDNDFWKSPNFTSFSPFTNPSSHTNLGADSHVSITNISASDTIMTADINIDWMIEGWPQMSDAANGTNPIIAHLGSDSTSQVIMTAGNRLLIWNYDGGKFIENTDSVGLIKYDGRDTIFYPSATAAICDAPILGRPVPVDFDGDNSSEIAVTTSSGKIYMFQPFDRDLDGGADPVAGFPLQMAASAILPSVAVKFLPQPGMQLLNFDNSGNAHIIYDSLGSVEDFVFPVGAGVISRSAYASGGKNIIDISQISAGGAQIERWVADSGSINFSRQFQVTIANHDTCFIASADIERSGGLPDIIVVEANGIKLIDPDSSIRWSNNIGSSLGHPAVGDINSDGYPEIVVAGDSKIYAFNHTGSLLENFPINLSLYDLDGVISSTPVLGDVNNDGNPDIIVGLPSGAIYAFDYHADRIAGYPLPTSFSVDRACALGDIDHNGTLDLVAVENSGFVKAWNLSTPYAKNNIPWGFAGGDIQNSNYLAPSYEKPVVVADVQLPEKSVYNYPNPASNSTTIRYHLNSDSQVKINIYDLMGDCINSIATTGAAHADNEYVWDCSDVASGIYYCRVEADSGIDKVWRLFKIAIVK
jgi:M6 family metalloprotease-like protein